MSTETLDDVVRELKACRICRDAPLYGAALPHEPRPVLQVSSSARLCLAGQAPGTRVHASGRPFTDPSGDRLRFWLGLDEVAFYDEARVAILPMGHCFPGLDSKKSDLPPRRECAEIWRARLLAQLPNIELIVLIGRYAQDWHLGHSQKSMTEIMQNWRAIFEVPRTPRLLPLPHPSWRNSHWLKTNPWFEAEVLPALRGEVQRLTYECCV